MVGGVGGNTFNMTNGDIAFAGVAGPNVFNAGNGTSLIVEGQGATTINLGTGTTTDFASFNGSDTYVATKGQGGTANIIGFKANDQIKHGGRCVECRVQGNHGLVRHHAEPVRWHEGEPVWGKHHRIASRCRVGAPVGGTTARVIEETPHASIYLGRVTARLQHQRIEALGKPCFSNVLC